MNKKVGLTLIFITLVLLFIITTSGCFTVGTETRAEGVSQLKNKIDEITKGNFKVALHEEYPIIYAYLRESPELIKNGPYFVTVMYGFEKGDLAESSTIKEIEETQGFNILYGPYEGNSSISVQYSPSGAPQQVTGVDDVRNWKINDKEVEFYYISRSGKEMINVNLSLDEGGINIIYFLSDKFTEEDVRGFTAFLLEEMD